MSVVAGIKRSYTSHPFSERKRVVELYEQGLGSKRIARETGLDASMVRQWLRRYRASGLEALQLVRTRNGGADNRRAKTRARKDEQFDAAFQIYATTLEPIASIARRFQLDYRIFKYHIEHHHPELVETRRRLAVDTPLGELERTNN